MLDKKIKDALKIMEDGDVNEVTIDVDDAIISVRKKGYQSSNQASDNEFILLAPMVGIVSLTDQNHNPLIQCKNPIKKNDVLLILESLKIQHSLLSEHDGIIEEIYIQDKQLVEYNQPLLKIRL